MPASLFPHPLMKLKIDKDDKTQCSWAILQNSERRRELPANLEVPKPIETYETKRIKLHAIL